MSFGWRINMNIFSAIELQQAQILLFFQSIRTPFLNGVFIPITITAEGILAVLISTVLYWCISKRYGIRLIYSLLLNMAMNVFVKDFFRIERPIGKYGIESIRERTATGYSFPSGHTQNASSLWSSLAICIRKKWIYAVAFVMTIAVALSRLYLGVHWPTDVIAGAIFGLIGSVISISIIDSSEKKHNFNILYIVIIVMVIGLALNKGTEYTRIFGASFGATMGYIVETKFIGFKTIEEKRKTKGYNPKSDIGNYIKRYIIGIVSLGAVYIGLKYISAPVVHSESEFIKNMVYFIRYMITVFWGTAVVPAVFVKMGI